MAYSVVNNMSGSSGDDYLGNVTISAGGSYTLASSSTAGAVYTIAGAGNTTWATASNPYIYTTAGSNGSSGSLNVRGDAEFAGDVKIQGISIVETLNKINERLAILVPDPKLLEKYEALKQAYEHYKLLEALCVEQNNPPPKP